MASFAAGVTVMPRAVGGWAPGRDARAADHGLGWPRKGRWGRQESVRAIVSNSFGTRDF